MFAFYSPVTCARPGCTLAAFRTGSGPPVVMIQGVGLHGGGWQPQVEGLAARYTCLWYDHRGIGASGPVGADLSVPQMAADVLALMDGQGWESAHLMGHSMGGLIALETALTARRRVRSLSLLCTFPKGSDATRLTWRMMSIGLRSRVGTRRQRRRAFLEIVYPPGVPTGAERDALAARLAALFGHDLAEQPAAVMPQLRAMRRHDVTPRLGELAGIPALVLSAAHDPIAPPACGRAIAAGIEGTRYIGMADAAHGAPVQHAARVNGWLLEHLDAAEEAWGEGADFVRR